MRCFFFFPSDNCKQSESHKRIKKVIYHETIFTVSFIKISNFGWYVTFLSFWGVARTLYKWGLYYLYHKMGSATIAKLRRQERGMDMSLVVPQKVLCIGLASPHEIWMYLPSSLVTHTYIYYNIYIHTYTRTHTYYIYTYCIHIIYV